VTKYKIQKYHQKISLTSKLKKNKFLHKLAFIPFIFIGLSIISLVGNFYKAQRHSSQEIEGYLVLGGSIMREIHVAQIKKMSPEIPVIISSGSAKPCVYSIFQEQQAIMDNVWLETCANSTFTNFIYSIPLLKKWGIKKVGVITSETHLPRAEFLAKILLKSQGISIELVTIPEQKGISANHESQIKTALDITRAIGWSVISQFISVPCPKVAYLGTIDLEQWRTKEFRCERRGNVKIPKSLQN